MKKPCTSPSGKMQQLTHSASDVRFPFRKFTNYANVINPVVFAGILRLDIKMIQREDAENVPTLHHSLSEANAVVPKVIRLLVERKSFKLSGSHGLAVKRRSTAINTNVQRESPKKVTGELDRSQV